VVVGGGPAGLEAARLAAVRGHKVTLLEASKSLGGMINTAAKCPGRHGIRDITVWLEAEIYHLGVDVRLSTYAEADDILAEKPDCVILATGSYPRMDGVVLSHPGLPIRNFEAMKPMSSLDLLAENRSYEGQTAIVIDDAGQWEAIGSAEYLIDRGATVHFVTRHVMFAHLVAFTALVEPALERLNRGGKFHLYTRHRVTGFDKKMARIEPNYGGSHIDVPADVTVFVSVNHANRGLHEELRNRVPDLRIVGDAKAPRYLDTAIREGHLAGRTL